VRACVRASCTGPQGCRADRRISPGIPSRTHAGIIYTRTVRAHACTCTRCTGVTSPPPYPLPADGFSAGFCCSFFHLATEHRHGNINRVPSPVSSSNAARLPAADFPKENSHDGLIFSKKQKQSVSVFSVHGSRYGASSAAF